MEITSNTLVKPKYGTMPQLMRVFKLSKGTISLHLSGKVYTKQTNAIKALAITLGGKPYKLNYSE